MPGLRAAGIVGTGSYLPEKILNNATLERMVDTSNEWIMARTGISERRLAAPTEATSDLCLVAAGRALKDAGVSADDVDMIIVATVTPDMAFPATACLVQEGLGALKAAAFDLEAGCSGFMYGLSIANQFVATAVYDTVLVIGAETFSRIVNWADRATCILFGDGAGAAVVRPVAPDSGIMTMYLGADGGGGKWLCQPAGGSRQPASPQTMAENLHTIHMHGQEVFKFAVRAMGDSALEALSRCGLTKDDVDVIVPHQANLRIIEATSRRLNLPMDKVLRNVERYGNISSGSIPIALDEAARCGRINNGNVVLLVTFGAGFTFGASVMRWTSNTKKGGGGN